MIIGNKNEFAIEYYQRVKFPEIFGNVNIFSMIDNNFIIFIWERLNQGTHYPHYMNCDTKIARIEINLFNNIIQEAFIHFCSITPSIQHTSYVKNEIKFNKQFNIKGKKSTC